ncbi:hypothetical protein [Paracoccus chinensis]|uniref:hypothetical protein n=1 Tax=Paracoccus chinensis TaxID=525640 RepID=UPI0011140287|nr:hypothetical protein [Paracoccus chinensis]
MSSIALSALATAIRGKPEVSTPGITTQTTTAGGTIPQRLIFGRYATAGQMVAPMMVYQSDGNPNEWLVYVISLADKPITGLGRIFVDGKALTIDGSPAASLHGDTMGATVLDSGQESLRNKIYIRLHHGGQTEADAYLRRVFGTYPERPWTADMIGTGVAYAVVTFKGKAQDGDYNGFPAIKFEVDGHPLYDPRDATQDPANEATWKFTRTAAVMAYNVLRGVDMPGGGTWGVGTRKFHLPSVIAAMNLCDQQVPRSDGTMRPRYQAGLEVSVSDEPHQALMEFVKAMGGDVADMGGTWLLAAGEPGGPVLSITDDDIIVTDSRSLKPYPGLDETINAIHASYPDPAQQWEAKEAVPIYNAQYEAADGGRRLIAEVDFPAVPYPQQVRALMGEMLADHRRMRTHVNPLPPDALGLRLCDHIAWASGENFYTAKLFKISALRVDPLSLCVAVTKIERDPSDYDDDAARDGVLPTIPSSRLVAPVIHGISGWAVQPVDAGGRPGIRMVWNPELNARALSWTIRLADGSEEAGTIVNSGTTSNLAVGEVTQSAGLKPATTYSVTADLVLPGRMTESVTTFVTTLDIRFGWNDLVPSVKEQVEAALEGVRVAKEQAIAAEEAAAAASAHADEVGRQVRQDLAVDFETAIEASGQAQVARGAAEGARDAALAARDVADGAARAAAGSAETASAKADEAGQKSAAAAASATAAETQAGKASTSATQAAASETSAAGSASAAASSATVSATALSGVQQALVNTTALLSVVPSPATRAFTASGSGLPGAVTPFADAAYGSDSGGPYLQRESPDASNGVRLRQTVPSVLGNVYRVTVRVKASHAMTLQLVGHWLRADGTEVNGTTFLPIAFAAGETRTLTAVVGSTAGGLVTHVVGSVANWTEAASIRFGVVNVAGVAGSNFRVYVIRVDDLTQADAARREAEAAGLSAGAAVTKASEAAASADAAGQSAAAADRSKVDANTAKAAAEVARGDAVVAKQDAETARAGAQSYSELSARISSRGFSVLSDSLLSHPGWTRWGGAATLNTLPNEQYPTGMTWQFTTTGTESDGIRLVSSDAPDLWKGQTGALGYVIEVEYTLLSGGVSGSGVWLSWNCTPNTDNFTVRKKLIDMTTGTVIAGRPMVARAVFKRPAFNALNLNYMDLYVFANYDHETIGPARNKDIKFHRVNVRLASEEEMGRGEVMAEVEAKLSRDYMTSASTTEAIASMRDTLVARMGGTEATVAAQGTALVGLQNAASAGYLIKAKAGGQVSLLELIAADGSAGSVSVAKMEASHILLDGSVSTRHLLISDWSNLVPDNQIVDPAAWATSVGVSIAPSNSTAYRSLGRVVFTRSQMLDTVGTSSVAYPRDFFPVETGDRLKCSAQFLRGGGEKFRALGQVLVYDKDDNAVQTLSFADVIDESSYTPVEGEVTVTHAAANKARFRFYVHNDPAVTNANVYLSAPVVRKMNAGKLLVDGSVTAKKINVDSLSAITATLGTMRTATSGERLEIRSNMILVYDASNTLRVRIGEL